MVAVVVNRIMAMAERTRAAEWGGGNFEKGREGKERTRVRRARKNEPREREK
jgi:hypothetical protein